jgi:hypothetical protein
MTDNTTFNTVLDTFGWFGLGFTLVGLIVSAFTLTYYMGYKKGGGEWRGTDLFAPKPIRLPYDAEIVTEVEILRNKLKGERNEVLRLRKQVEKQYAEIHNGKQMPAPRKRKPTLTTRNIYVP